MANVGPIGCIPFERDINGNTGGECASFSNQMAELFNADLRGLVAELRSSLEGSNFVYANVYSIVDDIIRNYESFGLFYLFFCFIYIPICHNH